MLAGLQVPWREWFFQETLTYDDMMIIAVVSAVFYAILAFCGYLFDTEVTDPKNKNYRMKMSWFITMANSFCMSVLGVIYVYHKFPNTQLFGFLTVPCMPPLEDVAFVEGGGVDETSKRHATFFGKDDFGVITCIIFGVANILDIFIGVLFYYDRLDPLTAWFHHPIFIWLMCCAITTEGIFCKTATPFVPTFMVATPEEIPTFLLAFGRVFPSFRSDLGFGITFFILRLVCHGMYTKYAFQSEIYSPCLGMYTLTSFLHVVWFKGWISGQGARYLPQFIRNACGIKLSNKNTDDNKAVKDHLS